MSRSWDDVQRYFEATYQGGNHTPRDLEIFGHGMATVFNWLRANVPIWPETTATMPIPMVLHCPECRTRHVDAGEFATKVHHTHSCQGCGLTWRPAVVATVGGAVPAGVQGRCPGRDLPRVRCLGTATARPAMGQVPGWDVHMRSAHGAGRDAMSEPRTAAEAYDDLVGMLEAAAPSAMDLRDGAQATRSTLMALVFDCQVLAARSRAASPPAGEYASYEDVSRALTANGLRVIELEAQVRRLQEIVVAVERATTREALIKLLYDAGLAGGVLAAEVIQNAIRKATRRRMGRRGNQSWESYLAGLDAIADYDQTAEEAEAELRDDGVDVDAFKRRVAADPELQRRRAKLDAIIGARDDLRKAGTCACGRLAMASGEDALLCPWCADTRRNYRRG